VLLPDLCVVAVCVAVSVCVAVRVAICVAEDMFSVLCCCSMPFVVWCVLQSVLQSFAMRV